MARVTTGPAGSLPLGCGCGGVCREGAWIIPVASDPSGVLVPEQGPVIAVLTTAPTGGDPGSWYNPGTDADGWRPYGEGEWGECKVILVDENPTGTLAGAAGTIAVLTAAQGEEGAPAVFFKPATAGTAWIKVPVILQSGQSVDTLPPPGTMRLSSTGDLSIFVDETLTAEVPVTYLKTLYAAREKIASFMTAAPASIFAFNQETDPNFPLNTGIVAQTLDGFEYPEKVGALAISYDGTRAFQRRPGAGEGKLWKPLHTARSVALGSTMSMDLRGLELHKTGPARLSLSGASVSGQGPVVFRLRLNPTADATSFQAYWFTKFTRTRYVTTGGEPTFVVTEKRRIESVSADDTFYQCGYNALHSENLSFGDADPAGPSERFLLDLRILNPASGEAFVRASFDLWKWSVLIAGTNPVPAIHECGELMIWDPAHETDGTPLLISGLGIESYQQGEGGADPASGIAIGSVLECFWD